MATSVWVGWFGPIQISSDGTTVTFTNIAVTGQFFGPAADNTALPPYSFLTDTDTGYASSAANTLALVAGGTTRLSISSTAVTSTVPIVGPAGSAGAPAFTLTPSAADPDTGWWSDVQNRWYFAAAGTSFAMLGNGAFNLVSTGAIGFSASATDPTTADTILLRDGAASLQMGSNAAGVTNQLFKGPDRITSDGVGGNLTIAGGRNRGASAGGSVIFQTAPAAGAGVTGTLATALTIDSTKAAQFAGTVGIGTAPDSVASIKATNAIWSLGNIRSDSSYQINGAPVIISTAPTAAGTGMTIAVGTGSTAFAFTLTITTANAQSAFTLTLPTATNGWQVFAQSLTNPGSMKISVSSRSTSTAVLTQYSQTTGLAAAYADGNVIFGIAVAN